MTKKSTDNGTDDDPIAAATRELKGDAGGTPQHELAAEASMVSGALDTHERPAALTVEGVTYVWMPEIGEYASEEGDMLDLKRPAAVKALFAWRKHRAEVRAIEAAQEERAKAGPDDVHLFHVEQPLEFGEFESGRRWVLLSELTPGVNGNEGVKREHGVVVRFAPTVDEHGDPIPADRLRQHVRMLHFRIVHIDEKSEVVSLEPGERLRGNAVTFYPKPYVYAWLDLVAAVDRTTVERWVNKLVHQAYAISDIRTAQVAGSGMAGKVGANTSVMHDLQQGRKARGAE